VWGDSGRLGARRIRGWRARRLPALAGLLALLWSACRPASTPTPSGAESAPPAPEPSPTCYLQPLPTGEKYSQVVIKQSPPARARPGETIEIELADGYRLIARYERVCGEGEQAGTVFADELPGFRSERTAQVYLDDQPVTAVPCG
jgi:hypothetical protein